MITIDGLVAQAKQDGASDIHIICGLPPKYSPPAAACW